ncbi:MAG: Vitamin B12 import ATP-binding protein BtuD [Hyphomicrobiaceae bacterium hypho_1]
MSKEKIISVRNLYKIFGLDPASVLQLAQDGIEKSAMLEEHGYVIGLRDINIDMTKGEITVIMGLSGSGKSTLIRHLNRLIDPTSGEILLNGIDIMSFSKDELRQLRTSQMSMVFQKFALLPHRNVVENASIALQIRGIAHAIAEQDARQWLERVGLAGFEDQYPHQLSGGMQQRVGIARALTSNAPIMLMDEAFSALDPLIRTDMQDLLLELQSDVQKTIVFITHDLDEALKLADHLVILKDGYVVQQGEPQHILLNPNDPYIENFVSDINRARVLRVRSVMSPLNGNISTTSGEVDYNDTLENVIGISGGDTAYTYTVMQDGRPVGLLHMKDLVKALVPRTASESGMRVF